ncbi:hypothetical protein AX17_001466 [Amanita inopinata Kibby_2008]|nr:hypothetical protein AX17_001466 [Amanita inopinata Kibby_2008]
MSLKAELETWAAALKAYDDEDFEKALDLFSRIADSSKILTNMGLIYATLGEHDTAIEKFVEATNHDQYLAVAYFQCGVSNFLLTHYQLALNDFEEALLYLRGNQAINYEQLGLKFKLSSAEVLFNKGLSLIYMGRVQEGMATLEEARKQKTIPEHDVIEEAMRDRGTGYTVFSIPVGVVYRPSEKKLKNAVTKDYLGKARLVAASDPSDIYTEFTGIARLKQGISPTNIYVDRPDITPVNLTRSATAPGPAVLPLREFDSVPKSAGVLERSKTTIAVAPDARERTSGKSAQLAPTAPLNTRPHMRNNHAPSPDQATPAIGIAGLSRGPSVGRSAPPAALNLPPVTSDPLVRDNRVTDFYDNYLDSYGGIEPDVPTRQIPPTAAPGNYPADRVAAWTHNNSVNRSGMRSAPASSYAPSSYGGSMRRKGTKRMVPRRVPSYEEEEGYGSGEYEEIPYDLQKIRVKIHYQEEMRGMAISSDTTFVEFVDKLTSKFNRSLTGLGIKFKDEDGGQVSLRDESDYELAIETAREAAKGKSEGKLEIWCADV